ncbi:cell envelope integrity protein TolA [Thalassotalea crassostreae]|nr:cell envelope integrity protein TolA [Thalassotalea crassostreae]
MSVFTYLPDGKTVKQEYIIAISAAVAVHIVMGIVLMLNTDFTPKPKPTPKPQMQVIDAVVIDQAKLNKQVEKLRKEKQAIADREAARIKELERRADDARKKRQKEADRIKKLEADRKKKEVEKKKADDAAKKAKALALKEENNRKKKVEERKKAEKAAADAKAKRIKEEKAAEERRRKKIEDEKKRKAEAERKKKEAAERAEQERLLEQQMLEEMASRNSARSQQVMSEVDKYSALIKQAIQRNFIDDPSYAGKHCQLKINLAASGFVIDVKSAGGDQFVCREAIKAVNKTGTLPVSEDPEVFKKLKNISLKYQSEYE